ncbi:MAG TPA: cysteine desulfhydrase [Gammaproteobacteria bacterium]|jgi:D-cysteine desulfhydrase/L-cysteate sulfo-lyase|nr:cysteine desulfhydrase [Acidiferrobacteraceae bacterium]MDP6551946.1 D-cysteine desulfhydrase family protein [Arenicellales bacterium]MDP6792284.1 D-cysteine desulfhydrase family protein [Arenicellales bacterium]MDP6919418.1 D-cysteine desulfhydrase family protein [Arenicellales bacterium]HCX87016.1 cysteine desulfhydrase [Gammaproteobacteria bacterium]|tara:strand:+ start:7015 stop:8043 length:1029 start_codon:yes stop_codon:yes gene_type:complete
MSISAKLDALPRTPLAHAPTPIERLNNLSAVLGGGPLYVKRDDCTGLAMGGNKARQLEYYFGEALEKKVDTVLITGAVQSNFVRMAAAAAAKLGLDCHIQLEERVGDAGADYRQSGNVLLDRILGATIHTYPEGEDEAGADANLKTIADELDSAGKRPYIIPLAPGHPPLGALGYVRAAAEILSQVEDLDDGIDDIFVASGSGSTHAGLLFGFRSLDWPIRVTGVCVRRNRDLQLERIANRCQEIARLLDMDNPVTSDDIRVTDETYSPGYGKLNDQALEAIDLCARREGLLLDPVYTGKAMAACLSHVRGTGKNQSTLFVHTGGTPGLFGYAKQLPLSEQA